MNRREIVPDLVGPEQVEPAVRSAAYRQTIRRNAGGVKNEHRAARMVRPKSFGHFGSRSREIDLSNDEPFAQQRVVAQKASNRGTSWAIESA